MQNPLISVIVPIYNVEAYLDRCVKSIVAQTYKNLEILLVDDGSPDNSPGMCDDWAKRDERIRVIHKKNGGLSSARIEGQKQATGDWITFLDSDDWMELNCFEFLVDKMASYPSAELLMFAWVKDFGNKIQHYTYNLKEDYLYAGDECKELEAKMLDFNNYIGDAVCKLIRRDFLESHNIYHEERLKQGVEGIVFSLKLFDTVQHAVFFNQPFYHYFYNASSITGRMNIETTFLLADGLAWMDDFIKDKPHHALLEESFKSRVVAAIVTSMLRGIFSPHNKFSYQMRVAKAKEFLQKPIVQKYLQKYRNDSGLPKSKEVVASMLFERKFFLLYMAAYMRDIQLKLKHILG